LKTELINFFLIKNAITRFAACVVTALVFASWQNVELYISALVFLHITSSLQT